MKTKGIAANVVGLAAVFALGSSAALAADVGAVMRSLQQLQTVLDQNDRDNANRRAQAAAEQARRDAADAQKKRQEDDQRQRAAAARAQASSQELAALAPPPEWANHLVINRKLLERNPASSGGEVDIMSRMSPAVSQDSSLLAYVNTSNQVVVRPFAGGPERVVYTLPKPDSSVILSFAGNQALLINGISGMTIGVELVDFQGRVLMSWPKGWSVYAYEDRIYGSHQTFSPHVCHQVALYDTSGKPIAQMDLSGQSANRCDSRLTKDGKFQVIVQRGNEVSIYVNGQQTASFSGDGRKGSEYASTVYVVVEDGRYAVSWLSGGEPEKTMPFRVWDVRANKLLCELPRNDGWLGADKQGRVSISTPPASVDVPNCRLQALNIPGRFFRDGDFAAVMDGKSGQLTLLDADTLQVRKTVTTQVRGDYISARATAPGSQYVIVGNPAYGDDRSDDFAQVFDSKTGQLVQQPAGRLRGSSVAYTLAEAGEWNKVKPIRITRIVQSSANGKGDAYAAYLKALRKDKYETTAEYRNRVAKLAQPFEMEVAVRDYNADGSYFSGTYQGVPIGVPMPSAQARRLDGMTSLSVKGQLNVVDEDFLELRNASITLQDGSLVQVPQSKLPARRAVQAGAAATTPGVMLKTSAAASGAARGGSASAECRGDFSYMAPDLRAYTNSDLAQARQAILTTSVPETMADMRRKGVTMAIVNQRIAELDEAANQAAQTANQTDGGGNSIQKAKTDTLPLNWPCEGIHSSAVCVYILQRWEAQLTREVAGMMSKCGV
ncbi:hypothetical protein [Pandoraea bronchicola]|uniref:Uncharacterized protein n=1 Tax=Pandoraea bronchicola TaxID=2508287 RepID=A0A5E5BQ65_9BURK|nr:hypothetical protein [Pandoraea bronchicola]VVE87436.1 hypothetical protein PBR20603_01371 [Pandoraea bronchicola]